MSICAKTSDKNYPHHWKCIETDGHKGCTCDQEYCQVEQCTLEDGTHRVPDGSIAAKDHLEAGGIVLTTYSLGVREIINVVTLPSIK